MDFSYRDELHLVRYLADHLERRLGARNQPRTVNQRPKSVCHLGVLEAPDRPVLLGGVGSVENSQEDETQAEVGASQRRPTSALGFEIVAEPDQNGIIELKLEPSFAVYSLRLPSLEEQLDSRDIELGGDPSAEVVELAQVVQREDIEYPAFEVSLDVEDGSREVIDLTDAIQNRLEEASNQEDAWLSFDRTPTVTRGDLQDEESFEDFLEGLRVEHQVADQPPIRALLDVKVFEWGDAYRVCCYLRNASDPPESGTESQYRIIADAKLNGKLTEGNLSPVEMLQIPEDYQYDREVWVVGHNTGAELEEESPPEIQTYALARYEQLRETPQNPDVSPPRFDELSEDPSTVLEEVRQAMEAYGSTWEQKLEEGALGLDAEERDVSYTDLESFRDEEERMAAGIAALKADDDLLEAFKGMNRVISRIADGEYESWRLFQIVFILTQLPALAHREGIEGAEHPQGRHHDFSDALEWGDVLWFPTGGGKTEAYLGLICCAMLYDRLRGKTMGVTAWLRFPLRMLSVQQLQRAAAFVFEAERERQSLLGDSSQDSDPLTLGYYVGKNSTPNLIREDDLNRIEDNPEEVLMVPNCPGCGSEVRVTVDRDRQRIKHVCDQCGVLPVFVTDEEIYRYTPALLVGTVDKMATIGFQNKMSQLWGGVDWQCPQHGYSRGDYCRVYGCDEEERIQVTPYDAGPSLHIQDELHLLKEDLGAYAGHYETLLQYCEEELGSSRPKVIAATATIEGFEHQVNHIYGLDKVRRFPGRGYQRNESFYTTVDRTEDGDEKVSRVFLGFRPDQLRPEDASSLCNQIIIAEVARLIDNPYELLPVLEDAQDEADVLSLLVYYTTTLAYVGKLSSGTRIRDDLSEKMSGTLHELGQRLRKLLNRDGRVEFHSSRSTMSQLADLIERLENPPEDFESKDFLDAVVATSIISHGVDVERLNLMTIDGIPEKAADYIQASSRAGRSHVGLITTVMPSYDIRASSIYHRFAKYHEHLDRLVAPVPVNRFAKNTAERTVPGMLTGVLLGRYDSEPYTGDLRKTHAATSFIQEHEEDLIQALQEAYRLNKDVYPSELVQSLEQSVDDKSAQARNNIRASTENRTADAVNPQPMFSLRDVEESVPFAPDTDSGELSEWMRNVRS